MPLIERKASPKAPTLLSRDSDVYKHVYDLLEKHTVSWMTDEWQKQPDPNKVRVTPLKHISRVKAIALAEEHDLSKAATIAACERHNSEVVLHINDVSFVVPKSIAEQIMTVINTHVS